MKKTSITAKVLFFIGLLSLPFLTFAQGAADVQAGFISIGGIVNSFTTNIVRALATLFATSAMVAFFYGIVQYIWGIRDGSPDKVSKGNTFMIWGMVALFVMFSVWGIVTYAQNIFGIKGQNTIVIPSIQLTPGGSSVAPSQNTAPGLPPAASVPVNGCLSVNASCTTSTGQVGTCRQGNASRDYTIYCSPSVQTSPSAQTQSSGCLSVNTSCTTSTGQAGTCVQGGSSRDYTVYCSENTQNQAPSNGSDTNSSGINCADISDAFTCTQFSCSWSDADVSCSQ